MYGISLLVWKLRFIDKKKAVGRCRCQMMLNRIYTYIIFQNISLLHIYDISCINFKYILGVFILPYPYYAVFSSNFATVSTFICSRLQRKLNLNKEEVPCITSFSQVWTVIPHLSFIIYQNQSPGKL